MKYFKGKNTNQFKKVLHDGVLISKPCDYFPQNCFYTSEDPNSWVNDDDMPSTEADFNKAFLKVSAQLLNRSGLIFDTTSNPES